MERIEKIWFEGEWIYGETVSGRVVRQSLLWYPRLLKASAEERSKMEKGFSGFHWRNLDEDISFDSFFYQDAEPSMAQRFYLTHPDISLAKVAEKIGMLSETLHRYLNGFIPSSPEIENRIMAGLLSVGQN